MFNLFSRLFPAPATTLPSANGFVGKYVQPADIKVTDEQLKKAKSAIDATLKAFGSNPDRREGALPYYRFHDAGKPVKGTVLIFHGFSSRPHQMYRIFDYLFDNGFNCYSCGLAGHPFISTLQKSYWPTVTMKPEYRKQILEEVGKEEFLKKALKEITDSAAKGLPAPVHAVKEVLEILARKPELLKILRLAFEPTAEDYGKYYVSEHRKYLEYGLDRLAEVSSLPGPVFTIGLSAGGSTALALAGERPDRVTRCVAYAPLLRVVDDTKRAWTMLTGALHVSPQDFDPTTPADAFDMASYTALDNLGSAIIMSDASIKALSHTPCFILTTENDDATDNQTIRAFIEALGGKDNGHVLTDYSKDMQVPHPMMNPDEISQGMTNQYYKNMYQETYRFLTDGTVKVSQVQEKTPLDPALPKPN